MNKQNMKKIAKGILFAGIFCIIFFNVQRVMQVKWIWGQDAKETSPTTSNWKEYRSLDSGDLDAIFLGTSHIYHAIDPMYIYENSGIATFAVTGPGTRIDQCYLSLEEALKTQTPEVVFYDISGVHWSKADNEARSHKVLDQLPLSLSKIQYAFTNNITDATAMEILFPLLRYHSRWDSLKEKDFVAMDIPGEDTFVRGHYMTYLSTPATLRFEEEGHEFQVTDYYMEYLEKMVKLCREKGVELVFFKVPAPAWYKTVSEGCAKMAEEFGVTYFDMTYDVEEMGLDPSTDYKDASHHMNQLGAEKVGDYMIQYMQEHYELRDQRGQNQRWDEDLVRYQEFRQYKIDTADTEVHDKGDDVFHEEEDA